MPVAGYCRRSQICNNALDGVRASQVVFQSQPPPFLFLSTSSHR